MTYLKYRRVKNIVGIDVSIKRCVGVSKPTRLGVGRAYEVNDTCTNNIRQLICGDVDFSVDIRSCGVYRLLPLVAIAYGLNVLNLAPENIIYPAGLYGESAKQCPWMRPMDDSEISASPSLTQGLSRIVNGNAKTCGMYCVNKERINKAFEEISVIIKDGWRLQIFDETCDIRDLITDKVCALLSYCAATG